MHSSAPSTGVAKRARGVHRPVSQVLPLNMEMNELSKDGSTTTTAAANRLARGRLRFNGTTAAVYFILIIQALFLVLVYFLYHHQEEEHLPTETAPPIVRDGRCVDDHKNQCVFVVQKLFGKPSPRRQAMSLAWYFNTTLTSIRTAAANTPKSIVHVGVTMHVADDYTSHSNEFEQHGLIASNHTVRIRQLLSENNCTTVTTMGLDADDMVLPKAFQNVREGWEECYALHGKRCISITGMKEMQVMTYSKGEDGLPTARCHLRPETRTEFFSQGLSVTMTTSAFEMVFGGRDELIYVKDHDFLFAAITQMVAPYGLHTESHPVVDHGLFLHTPLSSHFQDFPEAVDCDLNWMIDKFGEQTGHDLWRVYPAIPVLTPEEQQENFFACDKKYLKDVKAGKNPKYTCVGGDSRSGGHKIRSVHPGWATWLGQMVPKMF